MSDEAFAYLKDAMEDAVAFKRGKRRYLKVTRVRTPRPPKAVSPNISPKTVQAWEQGSREPGDAALKMLTIAKHHPEVLLET
jgi:DNA-binding transcriptional regulator YiaG